MIERISTGKRDKLLCCALRILKNQADAEDAVQTGLMLAIRRRGQPADEDAWVFTFVCNAARYMLRKRREQARWIPGWEYAQSRCVTDTPEAIASRDQCGARVRNEVARLPHLLRTAVELVDLEEMPVPDAAVALGIGIRACKSRLHRGRIMLEDKIKTWEEHARENAEEYRRQREEAWKKRQERENPEDPPLFHQPDEDTDC